MVDESLSQKVKQEVRPTPISPREALKYIQEGTTIVDIRLEYETNYRVFDFSNVIYLPFDGYKENYNKIPKNKSIIIVDNVGLKSPEVANFLVIQGYIKVSYMIGGIIEWDHYGLPLTKDLDYEFNGSCGCTLRTKK